MSLTLDPRPRLDEGIVLALVERVGGTGPVEDLGGTMSLNVHLLERDAVLRVHRRVVPRERLAQLQVARAGIAQGGLLVAEAGLIDGETLLDIGDGRLAEVEPFVSHTKPPATWEGYVWMFEAMGALHRPLAVMTAPLVEPLVATYGTPSRLRSEADRTIAAVAHDDEASALAQSLPGLIDALERQWTDPARLPAHIVHGDIRLGNVAAADDGRAAYFDFGFAAKRPRIHELAYSLFWMVLRPDGRGRGEEFTWDRVPELVETYEGAAGVRLGPIERRAFGAYLAAVPLYLGAVASHVPDPAAHLLSDRPLIEIAEWVLRNPGAIA